MKSRLPTAFLIVLVFWLIPSCTKKTTLVDEWFNENYKGTPIEKLMIFGFCGEVFTRKSFEEKISAYFINNGIDAQPSVYIITSLSDLLDINVQDLIAEEDIDAVLVVRLIDFKQHEHPIITPDITIRETSRARFIPGFDSKIEKDKYLSEVLKESIQEQKRKISRGGNIIHESHLFLDAKLFTTKEQKLLWQIQTETLNPENVDLAIQSIGSQMVESLSKHKVILQ